MKSPASLIWISIREDSFREWHGRGKAYRHSSVIAGSIILGQLNHGELTRGISSSLKKTLHSGGIYSVDRLKGIEIPLGYMKQASMFHRVENVDVIQLGFPFPRIFTRSSSVRSSGTRWECLQVWISRDILLEWIIESLVFLFPSLKMHNNLLCVQQKN